MAIEIIEENLKFNYFTIVMLIILAESMFDFYITFRQLSKKTLQVTIPDYLKQYEDDQEKFSSTRLYSIDKLKFNLLSKTIKLVKLLLELLLSFYPFIWNLSKTILEKYGFEDSEYKRVVVLTLITSINDMLIDVPLSLYFDFVIEERHGFNKKTLWVFIKDIIKGLLVSLLLTLPIVYGLIYLIENGGDYFYIYVEIFLMIMILFLMTIYPHVIAPLFNTFTELEDGELKKRIEELSEKLNFPLKKIFVVDGSTRSAHSNAYFFGLGNNKRIVLYDTLLTQVSTEEIISILCHEIGHWQHSHIYMTLGYTLLNTFIIFFLYGYFIKNNDLFLSFGFTDRSVIIGIGLFSMLFTPINFFSSLISLKLSRRNEFEADKYAQTLGYGKHLCGGLEKLNKNNKSDMDPDELYAACHYTHPTLLERLKYINYLEKNKKD